jgi:hypothetical protein
MRATVTVSHGSRALPFFVSLFVVAAASKMVNIPKYVLIVCAVSHTDPFIQDSPDM